MGPCMYMRAPIRSPRLFCVYFPFPSRFFDFILEKISFDGIERKNKLFDAVSLSTFIFKPFLKLS